MAPSSNDRLVVTSMSDVARLFGVSRECVKQWRDTRGMPTEGNNYNLPAIFKWWKAREDKLNKPKQPASNAELERRKLQADVAKRELQLAELEGSVCDRELMKAKVYDMFARVKHRLYNCVNEVTTSVPVDVRAIVASDMRHSLELVLREMENWSDERDD